jgi:Flp pilus assembly pilin Flp
MSTRFAKLIAQIRRLHADHRGVAAIEFGMILPIMAAVFLGTVEFGQALSADRRVGLAASSAADTFAALARLSAGGGAAAGQITTRTEADGIFSLMDRLLRPFDTGPLLIEVLSVRARTVGTTTTYVVDWSRNNKGGTPFARGHAFTPASIATFMEKSSMPPGVLSRTVDTIIISKVTYDYTPQIVGHFMPTGIRLVETVMKKPREFDCVILEPSVDCSPPT